MVSTDLKGIVEDPVLPGMARIEKPTSSAAEHNRGATYGHAEDGLLALVNLTLLVGHDDGSDKRK